MITLIYNEDGLLVADKKAIDWVKALKEKEDGYEVEVGSEAVFMAARVLVLEGYYTPDEIQLKYKEIIITISPKGRQSVSPAGFCDAFDEMLDRLLEL